MMEKQISEMMMAPYRDEIERAIKHARGMASNRYRPRQFDCETWWSAKAGVSGVIWERLVSPDKTGQPDTSPTAVVGFWGVIAQDSSGKLRKKPGWQVLRDAVMKGP